MFLIYPHFANSTSSRLLLDSLFTLTITFSLYERSQLHGFARILYLTSGFIAMLATWLALVSAQISTLVPTSYAIFFAITILIHAHELCVNSEVDGDTLLGAASAYIFIGLFFASVNALLVQVDPHGMKLSDDDTPVIYQLVYFSFVTLTTVGYGDILPTSDATRMLAAYEAIVGQVFVAIVVGLLVGKYLSKRPT